MNSITLLHNWFVVSKVGENPTTPTFFSKLTVEKNNTIQGGIN